MNYCRSLRFEDSIDYVYLRKMFTELFCKSKFEYDYLFDWMSSPTGEKSASYKSGKINIQITY